MEASDFVNVGATSASVAGAGNCTGMLLIFVVVVVSPFGNSLLVGLCAVRVLLPAAAGVSMCLLAPVSAIIVPGGGFSSSSSSSASGA